MARPTLSDAETAQLKKEVAVATGAAATFQAQIAAQQARAAELALTDSAFGKFFTWYNTDIISKYDSERKILDGQYIAAPVTEADIIATASLAGGRTQPALPATDLIRIAQFDGGPLVSTPTNETQAIADQLVQEGILVNGYPPNVSYPGSLLTSTALSPGSTSVEVTDSVSVVSFTIGAKITVSDGTRLALFRIDSVTPVSLVGPYVYDLGITMIVNPTGTIAIGHILKSFTGFNNTERTNKVPTDVSYQLVMDYLIDQLEDAVNARIARLNEQPPFIAANQDPDGTAQLTTATTNVNNSKDFLTTYLLTTDISNTGLSALSTERASRGSEITTRIAQIIFAYTGRTENYYNQRYSYANNRANTSRGTLRLQKNAEQSGVSSAAYAATLAAQAATFGSILE